MALYLEASIVDLNIEVPELNCPVYFFLSTSDYVANYQVAEQYFNHLQAEHKKLVWFEESTHEIPSQEPRKFAKELLQLLLTD